MDIICKYCGKVFQPNYKDQIYCSRSCKSKHQEQKALQTRMNNYNINPRICPYCGNSIPFEKRTNKFCSQNCANSYTNRTRKRKPWTLDRRLAFSKSLQNGKIYTCQYCGKLIPQKGSCCDECYQYIRRVKTFNKFGLTTGPLKNRYDEFLEILYNEYFILKHSLRQIYSIYKVDTGTLWKYIKINFGDCRDQRNGVLLAIEDGRLTPNNSNKFVTGVHISWDGVKYNYRSSWEVKFMKELDENKIPYKYEPFSIKYYNSNKKSFRIAFPDFYLPESNEIIELKSSYTLGSIQEMKDKFKAYKDLGYIPKLLLDWKYYGYDELDKII